MDDRTKTVTIVVCIVVIILLWFKVGDGDKLTVVNEAPGTDIIIDAGPGYEYLGGDLALPGALDRYDPDNGVWDWMQTTNMLCGCDTTAPRGPIFIEPEPRPQRPGPIQFVYVQPLPPAPPIVIQQLPPAYVPAPYIPPQFLYVAPAPPAPVQQKQKNPVRWVSATK